MTIASDLTNRGFHVFKQWLNEGEITGFQDDYASDKAIDNNAYALGKVSPQVLLSIKGKLTRLLESVKTEHVFAPNHLGGGAYFATEKGIDFDWHQDHESLFIQQTHQDYLNIYVPILKPNHTQSNLSIIPIDSWKAAAPEAWKLFEWQGASSARTENGKTHISNDHSGGERVTLNFPIDEISETPCLNPGDALLLRGDMFHKTQDTQTNRVALSVRAWNNRHTVTRDHFLQTCEVKNAFKEKNKSMYSAIASVFEAHSQLTIGELLVRSNAITQQTTPDP